MLRRIEAFVVEVLQIGGQEEPDIDVAIFEEVFHKILFAIFAVLLERPDVFLRAEGTVVVVEAPDPALAVLVAPVLRACIPPMHVAVNHKILLAVLFVHHPPCSEAPASQPAFEENKITFGASVENGATKLNARRNRFEHFDPPG